MFAAYFLLPLAKRRKLQPWFAGELRTTSVFADHAEVVNWQRQPAEPAIGVIIDNSHSTLLPAFKTCPKSKVVAVGAPSGTP